METNDIDVSIKRFEAAMRKKLWCYADLGVIVPCCVLMLSGILGEPPWVVISAMATFALYVASRLTMLLAETKQNGLASAPKPDAVWSLHSEIILIVPQGRYCNLR
jgi:hypothetical protein